MFPETFEAIKSLWREVATGLVFQMDGDPIPYKTIQWNFDRSFKAFGLPYRGTHVMRHGGCRRVFNHVGEIPIAQQLLGNSDLKTTLIYAKRHATRVGADQSGARLLAKEADIACTTACGTKIENRK